MRQLDYAGRLEVEAALDAAFEPLRSAHTGISPLRVRAAVRWGRGETARSLRWTRVLARISELSAAAGIAGMIFVASVGAPAGDPAATLPGGQAMFDPGFRNAPAVRVIDDTNWLRWFRLGRYVQLQDWLDPTVPRLSETRTPLLPTPLEAGSPSANGPF